MPGVASDFDARDTTDPLDPLVTLRRFPFPSDLRVTAAPSQPHELREATAPSAPTPC